jgi:hypothetical protein
LKRIVLLLAVATMTTLMVLVTAGTALAAPGKSQGVCSDPLFSGARAAPNVVQPGPPDVSPDVVFFNCVDRGEPGQPPQVLR